MPAKLDRCVSDVEDQGHDEPSAYAICNDSIKEIDTRESHNPLDIPFGHEVNEGGPGSGPQKGGAKKLHGEKIVKDPKTGKSVRVVDRPEYGDSYRADLYGDKETIQEMCEGGPGSGRKGSRPHGKQPGFMPPVGTPKQKPATPSSTITPMGKGKGDSSNPGGTHFAETEEDKCEKCGKTRADHGMFSDHDFEAEPELMDEEEEDVDIKSIKIDFVTESFSIPGSLSAQGVGAKKHQETICPCERFDKLLRALV